MDKTGIIENRTGTRQDVDDMVEVELHAEILSGRARNVSRDGMLIELPAGLRITVEHEGRRRTGTVVRVQAINPLRWAMGIHFDDEG